MSLCEANIRPADLLAEYLRLNAEDGKALLNDSAKMQHRRCPGCDEDSPVAAFSKNGFGLVHCGACGTLYVNPVPSVQSLEAFYRNSASSDYWAKVFFPAVSEARRGPIYICLVRNVSPNMLDT